MLIYPHSTSCLVRICWHFSIQFLYVILLTLSSRLKKIQRGMLNTANVVGLVGLKTIASLSHCVSTFVLHYGHYAALFLIKKTCRLSPGPYNGPGYSVPPSWCHWWQTMVKKRTYLTGAEPRPTERDPPARNGKRRTSRRSSMPSCKQVTTVCYVNQPPAPVITSVRDSALQLTICMLQMILLYCIVYHTSDDKMWSEGTQKTHTSV